MEEKKSSSNNKVLIIILTLLLFGLIGYTFYQSRSHQEAVKFLQDEKEQIISNLTAMEDKYDIAISENTSLSDSLTIEKNRIIALKDSVTNLKHINSSVLRRYRNQLKKLQAINDRLLDEVDSLKMISNVLIDEKDSISNQLDIQTNYNVNLKNQNEELTKKIEIVSVLDIKDLKVSALKMRSNGKYTETDKAQKTDAIKLEFRLMENEIATPGDKEAYVSIKAPNGRIINAKGVIVLNDSTEVKYTDQTIVNYENAELDVVMLIERKGDNYTKGIYSINVYVDGRLAGVSQLVLRDSFLGL